MPPSAFRSWEEERINNPQSLMRMLSTKGNPEAKNLFQLLTILQDHEGIDLKVSQKKKVKRPLV